MFCANTLNSTSPAGPRRPGNKAGQRWTPVLLSAFVLPGSGQIVNRHWVKGGVLIVLTTALMIWGVIKLYLEFTAAVDAVSVLDPVRITEAMRARDLTWVWILVGGGGALWLYGVVDAAVFALRNPGPPKE